MKRLILFLVFMSKAAVYINKVVLDEKKIVLDRKDLRIFKSYLQHLKEDSKISAVSRRNVRAYCTPFSKLRKFKLKSKLRHWIFNRHPCSMDYSSIRSGPKTRRTGVSETVNSNEFYDLINRSSKCTFVETLEEIWYSMKPFTVTMPFVPTSTIPSHIENQNSQVCKYQLLKK